MGQQRTRGQWANSDHPGPSHGGFWGGQSSDQGSSPRWVWGRSERPEQAFTRGRRSWAAGRTRLNFCFGGVGRAATERGRRGRGPDVPRLGAGERYFRHLGKKKHSVHQETAKSTRLIDQSRNARDPRTFRSSRIAGARRTRRGRQIPLSGGGGKRDGAVRGGLSDPFRRWCLATGIRGPAGTRHRV